jgi:hypothetical protein
MVELFKKQSVMGLLLAVMGAISLSCGGSKFSKNELSSKQRPIGGNKSGDVNQDNELNNQSGSGDADALSQKRNMATVTERQSDAFLLPQGGVVPQVLEISNRAVEKVVCTQTLPTAPRTSQLELSPRQNKAIARQRNAPVRYTQSTHTGKSGKALDVVVVLDNTQSSVQQLGQTQRQRQVLDRIADAVQDYDYNIILSGLMNYANNSFEFFPNQVKNYRKSNTAFDTAAELKAAWFGNDTSGDPFQLGAATFYKTLVDSTPTGNAYVFKSINNIMGNGSFGFRAGAAKLIVALTDQNNCRDGSGNFAPECGNMTVVGNDHTHLFMSNRLKDYSAINESVRGSAEGALFASYFRNSLTAPNQVCNSSGFVMESSSQFEAAAIALSKPSYLSGASSYLADICANGANYSWLDNAFSDIEKIARHNVRSTPNWISEDFPDPYGDLKVRLYDVGSPNNLLNLTKFSPVKSDGTLGLLQWVRLDVPDNTMNLELRYHQPNDFLGTTLVNWLDGPAEGDSVTLEWTPNQTETCTLTSNKCRIQSAGSRNIVLVDPSRFPVSLPGNVKDFMVRYSTARLSTNIISGVAGSNIVFLNEVSVTAEAAVAGGTIPNIAAMPYTKSIDPNDPKKVIATFGSNLPDGKYTLKYYEFNQVANLDCGPFTSVAVGGTQPLCTKPGTTVTADANRQLMSSDAGAILSLGCQLKSNGQSGTYSGEVPLLNGARRFEMHYLQDVAPRKQFSLQHTPETGTFSAEKTDENGVKKVLGADDYKLDNGLLTLTEDLKPGQRINLSYRFSGLPPNECYPLSARSSDINSYKVLVTKGDSSLSELKPGEFNLNVPQDVNQNPQVCINPAILKGSQKVEVSYLKSVQAQKL